MPWAFPRHSLTPMAQCHSADASVARLAYRAQKFDCAQASPRPVGQGTLTNISGALVGMRVLWLACESCDLEGRTLRRMSRTKAQQT
jgi:hypothetical protein